MRLAIHVLGLDLLTIELDADSPSPESEPGDCTTSAQSWMGFTNDTRWQPGGEP